MASDSYTAEHFASAISIKMAYDILKLHEAIGAAPPDLCFCFRLSYRGEPNCGDYGIVFRHATLGAVLRNLHRLIETRFDPTIQHWHVRGHSGHPGNELVDLLAQHAHSRPTTSITNWLDGLNTQTFKAKLGLVLDTVLTKNSCLSGTNISCSFASLPLSLHCRCLEVLIQKNADELDPSPVPISF